MACPALRGEEECHERLYRFAATLGVKPFAGGV
jgi:hypothetical protein